jgi:hypothetical protein
MVKITEKYITLNIEKKNLDLANILEYRKKIDRFFHFLENIAATSSVRKYVTIMEVDGEK